MSPVLAQSGHHAAEFQCPLLGVKRTLSKGAMHFDYIVLGLLIVGMLAAAAVDLSRGKS
jgi:hypothetical protein